MVIEMEKEIARDHTGSFKIMIKKRLMAVLINIDASPTKKGVLVSRKA